MIDREKWRLALLGGIEVRRASGNEEAGNGGSGAGGLSKPKFFHYTSRPYPVDSMDLAQTAGGLILLKYLPHIRTLELGTTQGTLQSMSITAPTRHRTFTIPLPEQGAAHGMLVSIDITSSTKHTKLTLNGIEKGLASGRLVSMQLKDTLILFTQGYIEKAKTSGSLRSMELK